MDSEGWSLLIVKFTGNGGENICKGQALDNCVCHTERSTLDLAGVREMVKTLEF